MRLFFISAPILLVAAVATSSVDTHLPNRKLTPGATVQVELRDICRPGYSKGARNVPESEKRAVYKEYGIKQHKPGSYEIDHLISLELGGSNEITNLWPQPYFGPVNAHIKDGLENTLHALVCKGKVSLPVAQHAIATNWVRAYERYVGPLPKDAQ